jgi:hypothetical protein
VKLTRRAALGAMGAPILFGQEIFNRLGIGHSEPNQLKIGYSGESKGTRIWIIDGGIDGDWFVGVNSDEDADLASVEVFFEGTITIVDAEAVGGLALSRRQYLLRRKTSLCPVVRGKEGMGATDENFTVPIENVKSIRVTLLKTVAQREFR